LERNTLSLNQGLIEFRVLFFVERTIQVVVATFVVTSSFEGDRGVDSFGGNDGRDSVVEIELVGNDVVAEHGKLGLYAIHFDAPDEVKFCENETNVARLYGSEDTGRLYKDGFDEYVVKGNQNAVGSRKGTKAAGIYRRSLPPGANTTIRVRLGEGQPRSEPFADFEQLFALREPEGRVPARIRPRRGPIALALVGLVPLAFGAWASFAGERPRETAAVRVEVTPMAATVVPDPIPAPIGRD